MQGPVEGGKSGRTAAISLLSANSQGGLRGRQLRLRGGHRRPAVGHHRRPLRQNRREKREGVRRGRRRSEAARPEPGGGLPQGGNPNGKDKSGPPLGLRRRRVQGFGAFIHVGAVPHERSRAADRVVGGGGGGRRGAEGWGCLHGDGVREDEDGRGGEAEGPVAPPQLRPHESRLYPQGGGVLQDGGGRRKRVHDGWRLGKSPGLRGSPRKQEAVRGLQGCGQRLPLGEVHEDQEVQEVDLEQDGEGRGKISRGRGLFEVPGGDLFDVSGGICCDFNALFRGALFLLDCFGSVNAKLSRLSLFFVVLI